MFKPYLTKWPRLLVEGSSVTPEQAGEILVRTNAWYGGNDKEWRRILADILQPYGIQMDNWGYVHNETLSRIGGISLNYLHNHRIFSSWIGGPHGWCAWDGTIGCSNYNIGKHPDISEVLDDWTVIAETFPFLDLRAQLCPNAGESPPCIEFTVKNGTVIMGEPGDEIVPPDDRGFPTIVETFFSRDCERGCSIQQFQAALEGIMKNKDRPLCNSEVST